MNPEEQDGYARYNTLEKESDNVNIGKLLHEDRYKRDSKEITIDETISIDFLRKGDSLVLHEIKKTKSMEEAHRQQMLYYPYYLKSKGVSASGEINYPLISKKEEIVLLEKDESDMDKVIDDIRKIATGRMPPPVKTKICKKCAYFEFCFGDET